MTEKFFKRDTLLISRLPLKDICYYIYMNEQESDKNSINRVLKGV